MHIYVFFSRESMERLAEASAQEAKAVNAVWQAAQAQAANQDNNLPPSDNSHPPEPADTEGDVRLHPRAVCLLFSLFKKLCLLFYDKEALLLLLLLI